MATYASIQRVVRYVRTVANKQQHGNITPEQIQALALAASRQVLDDCIEAIKKARERQADISRGAHRESAANELGLRQAEELIEPLYRETALTGASEVYARPNYVAYELGVYVNGRLVDPVDNHTFANAKLTGLAKPTVTNPIVAKSGTDFLISPAPASAKLAYYKVPQSVSAVTGVPSLNPPTWGYTIVNGREIYNPTTSFDFEFSEMAEIPLMLRMLEYIGINLRDEILTQYGRLDKNEKLQKP